VVSMLKYKNKGTGEYKIGLDFFTWARTSVQVWLGWI
jgi:hypothetical protein